MDVGALTAFWYFFRERENVYDLFEAACGARLTTSYTRVGGMCTRRCFPATGPTSATC